MATKTFKRLILPFKPRGLTPLDHAYLFPGSAFQLAQWFLNSVFPKVDRALIAGMPLRFFAIVESIKPYKAESVQFIPSEFS